MIDLFSILADLNISKAYLVPKMNRLTFKTAIRNGSIQEARECCSQLNIVTFDEFYEDDLADGIGLYFLILSIKNPKEAPRPLQAKGRVLSQYDRLIFCRELRSGKNFYILCENVRETTVVFKFTSAKYHGQVFCIHEPYISDYIHGLDVISSYDPTIIPVDLVQMNFKENDIGTHSVQQGEALVKSFLFTTANVTFKRVKLEKCCTSSMCDSNHEDPLKCPLQFGFSNKRNKIRIGCFVVVPEITKKRLRAAKLKYFSENLAQYFFTPEFLATEGNIEQGIEVNDIVAGIMLQYSNAKIPWVVAGWMKHTFNAKGEPSGLGPIHISACYPKHKSDTIQLYNTPVVAVTGGNLEQVFTDCTAIQTNTRTCQIHVKLQRPQTPR